MKSVSIATLLFVSAMLIYRPAVADTSVVTASVKVRHVDVNPSNPAAAMLTLDRLKEAAIEACGASPFSLSEYKAAVRDSACWHDTLVRVVARLGSAALSRSLETHPD